MYKRKSQLNTLVWGSLTLAQIIHDGIIYNRTYTYQGIAQDEKLEGVDHAQASPCQLSLLMTGYHLPLAVPLQLALLMAGYLLP